MHNSLNNVTFSVVVYRPFTYGRRTDLLGISLPLTRSMELTYCWQVPVTRGLSGADLSRSSQSCVWSATRCTRVPRYFWTSTATDFWRRRQAMLELSCAVKSGFQLILTMESYKKTAQKLWINSALLQTRSTRDHDSTGMTSTWMHGLSFFPSNTSGFDIFVQETSYTCV